MESWQVRPRWCQNVLQDLMGVTAPHQNLETLNQPWHGPLHLQIQSLMMLIQSEKVDFFDQINSLVINRWGAATVPYRTVPPLL